ncbi:MAG: hypothetical protein HC909_00175 [Blastochloris sp.]|nr:hypothetical protein [Blastochloris sp.]
MVWQAKRKRGGMSSFSARAISSGVILPIDFSMVFSFSVRSMPMTLPDSEVTSIRQEAHSPFWQSNGIGMLCFWASARMVPRSLATA